MTEEKGVKFNELTNTYDTVDGTKVAAEIYETATCLADVITIAAIREKQRDDIKHDLSTILHEFSEEDQEYIRVKAEVLANEMKKNAELSESIGKGAAKILANPQEFGLEPD